MMFPSISTGELLKNLDTDNFYKNFGNPVRCKILGKDRMILSFELYERLFGKVELDKENRIELDDFIRVLLLQRLKENPIDVTETEGGFLLSMEEDIYECLNRIILKDYGITFESLMPQFFEWVAANPKDFEAWIREYMKAENGEGIKKNDN